MCIRDSYVAVIDMPTLVPKATFDRKYEGVAKFPAMKRDLSMVMKKDIFVGQLEKIFKDKGGKLLESYELFDVYEGDQIEKGYKSCLLYTSERHLQFTVVLDLNIEKLSVDL